MCAIFLNLVIILLKQCFGVAIIIIRVYKNTQLPKHCANLVMPECWLPASVFKCQCDIYMHE